MKVLKIEDVKAGDYDYVFQCPGCKHNHGIKVAKAGYTGPIWSFNGDMDKPTISPSINYYAYSGNELMFRCHSFIRDGKIEFLSDCTHSLAGKTVELEDFK